MKKQMDFATALVHLVLSVLADDEGDKEQRFSCGDDECCGHLGNYFYSLGASLREAVNDSQYGDEWILQEPLPWRHWN